MARNNVTSRLEWLSSLSPTHAAVPTEDTKFLRKTNSVEKLAELRQAGVNIVRMNFSHGEYEYHQSVIDNTRKAVERTRSTACPLLVPHSSLRNLMCLSVFLYAVDPTSRPVAIALDTKGPEIRTGLTRGGADIPVKAGHEFTVSTDEQYAKICDDKVLYMDYKNLPKVTAPGKLIYV
ncbi:hypothetical protein EW145_g3821, partial [Phellinidium pouzarii]